VAVSNDGNTLYIAAKGSNKVGFFSTAQIENGTFVPNAVSQVLLTGGGPEGVVFDSLRTRIYVLTRFDNGISVVDHTPQEIAHVLMPNPEPASVVNGRRFLYDANLTSSNGEAACGSCHLDGDLDSLAWDLGNPRAPRLSIGGVQPTFHSMKGPMATQSLRGMANHGPMHWRGDRTGATAASDAQPDTGMFNEVAAFEKFNASFESLLGGSPLSEGEDGDMRKFTNFILQISYPPNPIRNLDNLLTAQQGAGQALFLATQTTCNTCHFLDRNANAGLGFFGTDGQFSYRFTDQNFKTPHLRNLYQKVGMFGMPVQNDTATTADRILPGDNGEMGDQIRGFGFTHDGSVDTVFRRLRITMLDSAFLGTTEAARDVQRRQVEQFMFAFDSNLMPIVGQQITLSSTNASVVNPRIDLMINRAAAGECDVVVKGKKSGVPRGWWRVSGSATANNAMFRSDKSSEALLGDKGTNKLRSFANTSGQELTYSCVPFGSGQRVGIDRDEDLVWDADEMPTTVKATAGTGKITVTWVKPVGTNSASGGYELMRITSTGVVNIVPLGSTILSYVDTLPKGTLMNYQVRAKDAAGKYSEFSAPIVTATAK
jgi:hypothetical protein